MPEVDAATLAPRDGCPTSRDAILKKHGDLKVKEGSGWNLLVAADGTVFMEIGAVDQVISDCEPLATLSGEWLVGAEYEKANKSGSEVPKQVAGLLGVARAPPSC